LARVEIDKIQFKPAQIPSEDVIVKEMAIKYKSSSEDSYSDLCDKK
jgi:hypothetical protein